ALAPEVLGTGHPAQDPGLLLGDAELEDGRGQQEDAVLGDAGRAAGPVVLLLEEEPLPQRRAAAAVLDRPGHRRPAALEEAPLPAEVLGEALPGVTRDRLAAALGPPPGQVRLQPRPRLDPERVLLCRPAQVHQI